MKNTDHTKGLWALLIVTLMSIGVGYGLLPAPRDTQWQRLAMRADSLQNAARKSYRYSDSTYRFASNKNFAKKQFKPLNIELNSADSLQLLRVYGIGPVFASRIINYRKRLGGFIKIEQLMEIKGIDSDRFAQLYKNFYLDTALITKININFATQNILTAHPYISPSMAARIDKYRKSKGGFLNYKELIDKDILLPGEARKVAPYLSFN